MTVFYENGRFRRDTIALAHAYLAVFHETISEQQNQKSWINPHKILHYDVSLCSIIDCKRQSFSFIFEDGFQNAMDLLPKLISINKEKGLLDM